MFLRSIKTIFNNPFHCGSNIQREIYFQIWL